MFGNSFSFLSLSRFIKVRSIPGKASFVGLAISRKLTTFQGLGIEEELLQALNSNGITVPTQIQERSIPLVFGRKDLVINAETGSGKTLCYILPILNGILKKMNNNPLNIPLPRPSSIIFAPSIELMYQIKEVIHSLVDENKIGVCIAHKQSPIFLGNNTHVLVTHPEYLLKYKLTDFYNAESLVFDEADLLVTNYYTKVAKIIGSFTGLPVALNKKRTSRRKFKTPSPDHAVQCLCVGATMPARNRRSAIPTIRYCLPRMQKVESDLVHMGVPSLTSEFMKVEVDDKINVLVRTITRTIQEGANRILVFCESSVRAHDILRRVHDTPFEDRLDTKVTEWLLKARELNSSMSPKDRVLTVDAFRDGTHPVLFTTDLASRGLDIPDVTVIQYDVARNVADILHRAGRSARAGKNGKMISFVTDKDEKIFELFQEYLDEKKSIAKLFSRKQQLKKFIDRRSESAALTSKESL